MSFLLRISLASVSIAFLFAQQSLAQSQYPTTPYQSFGPVQDGTWSVTPPSIPDAAVLPGYDDSEAMSPDSWGDPNAPMMVPQQGAYPIPMQGSGMFVPNGPSTPQGRNNFVPQQNQNQVPNPIKNLELEQSKKSLAEEKSVFQSASYPTKTTQSENLTTAGSASGAIAAGSGRYPLGPGGHSQTLPLEIKNSYLGEPVPQLQSGVNIQPNYGGFVVPNAQQNTQPVMQYGGPQVSEPGFRPNMNSSPRYRPDLGHRAPMPTSRNYGSIDRGQKYDFEDKKKEYPPMSEILATGRYFGSVSILGLEPHFQSNAAIGISNGANSNSELFAFDLEGGPELRFGFESKYGPGIELSYMQVDATSDVATFTSNGTSVGETSAWMTGASRFSRLTAANAGDTINAVHEFDIEVFGVSFFKEVKLPISRINGQFGFQYAKIFQSLDATLENGGATLGTLRSVSDMEAYGPNLVLEYYRPVGHTKLEFLTTFGASVLFGDRNQFVENSVAAETSRIQANELITTFDFFSGAQYKKNIAENRSYFVRAGATYSSWIGGGTATDPQGNFGLRGFSFTVGYNR